MSIDEPLIRRIRAELGLSRAQVQLLRYFIEGKQPSAYHRIAEDFIVPLQDETCLMCVGDLRRVELRKRMKRGVLL